MSMWKKIKQLLNPQAEEPGQEEELEFVAFQSKDPVDVLFAKNFIAGGGQFFYCEDEQEALEHLQEIITNEQIDKAICFEDTLKSYLSRLNVESTSSLNPGVDFSFIECEYLVAFDGAIMLSAHKTNGRKLSSFPDNFIIFAHPGQLVSNISEALQRLKSTKSDNIPSDITSIRGKKMHNFDSSSNAKNIFLLLVEQN